MQRGRYDNVELISLIIPLYINRTQNTKVVVNRLFQKTIRELYLSLILS